MKVIKPWKGKCIWSLERRNISFAIFTRPSCLPVGSSTRCRVPFKVRASDTLSTGFTLRFNMTVHLLTGISLFPVVTVSS